MSDEAVKQRRARRSKEVIAAEKAAKAERTAAKAAKREAKAAADQRREKRKTAIRQANQALARKRVVKARKPKRSKIRAEIAAANKVIGRFQRAADVVPEAPTPHRLVKPGCEVSTVVMARATEHVRKGVAYSSTITQQVMRVEQAPLDRLASRRLLDKDRGLNAILLTAGHKYRERYEQAGLDPLRAPDPSRPVVDASRGGDVGKAGAFERYVFASKAMDVELRGVVDDIVLREQDLGFVGRKVSGYRQLEQARAAGVMMLRLGLRQLARYFNLVS